MKYLVMECHDNYAILLDEEVGFVRAKNTGLTVGETIENPQLLKNASSRKNIIMKVTYGLSAVAACVAVMFGINHYNEYITPYSNIRLSINPDVEMVLNHHGQVLSLKGMNKDGEMLVDGYNPKRQDKIVVADELIERAIDMGYLSDNAIIIFDIDTPDKELLTQYSIELRSEAEIYTHEFDNVNIVIIDHNQEKTEKHNYSDTDYEPIVIPIPQQTEITLPPETKPTTTKPAAADSGYEENDNGESQYEITQTNPPPATTPPVVAAPSVDSNYGDSNYEAVSNYGSSEYEADSSYN